MEDQQLWQEIQKNNESAFKRLFFRYYEEMVAFAERMVGNEDIAKDIAQDVFVKIWDRRAKLDIRESLRAYLLRATRNNSLNNLRSKRHLSFEDHQEPEDTSANVQEKLQAYDLENFIQQAIAKLPPGCRTVFLLKQIEGLSLKEIANELNISTKTVENQLTKARKMISQYLKPVLLLMLFAKLIYFGI